MAWQSLITTLAKSCTWQTERVARTWQTERVARTWQTERVARTWQSAQKKGVLL